jgi:pimeloyl-ACP methyl ester carboxylesterase
MSGVFKNYKGRAFIFWGKDDDVMPTDAAYMIKDFIKNSTLHILNGDHFFFLDKGKLIEEEILKENR